MKFPKKTIFTGRHVWHMFTLTLLVAIMAMSATAQRSVSGSKLDVTSKAILAEAATLEQCRNGQVPTTPRSGCTTVGGNLGWVTGNAGAANSNWAETQFLAYRMLFSDLSTAPNNTNTVIIGYDIFHQNVHAIDYLGTYNATETNANPCVDVNGCVLGDPTRSTFPIPPDTVTVTPFINQLPGEFTMWGGTITNVVYLPYAGGDERLIQVTFTSNVSNPVLAWSGHVAWRGDWGAGQSAGGISGSPYHMRLIDLNGRGGNQDRSLSADAVLVPGQVRIIKRTLFDNAPIFLNQDFSFSSAAVVAGSRLNFDGDAVDDGFFILNTQTTPQTPLVLVTSNLGPTNPYTVTEVGVPTNWSLDAINCSETGQVGFPAVLNTTWNVGTSSASIIVDEGETIICTFDNIFTGTTAAPASISGRVSAADGTGIYGARMVLTNASTGETHYAITNPFGYYTFEGMPVSDFYIIGVSRKGYTFAENQRTFTLDQDLTGVDFIAN